MNRRSSRSRMLAWMIAFGLAWPTALRAAPKDAAATKLANDAINTDYLATNFAAAEKKLRDGLALCGAAACSPQVRARLHRDLGVVLIAGLHRLDDGKRAFSDALSADPQITLEKGLVTPEIEKMFNAAKAEAAPSSPGAPSQAASPPAAGSVNQAPPAEPASQPPMPTDSADCPPGLPGCPSDRASAHKGPDVPCEQDSECRDGLSCKSGVCSEIEGAAEPTSSGRPCVASPECDPGEICTSDKVCEREVAKRTRKVWLSLNVGQDVSFVGSQPNVCGTPERLPAVQYTCIDQDGYLYRGVPAPAGPGQGNAVNGGLHLATTRIMAGIDVLVADNVTIGGRAGYAFGLAPGHSFSALHAEARVAFWFGRNPFARERVRPYLVVGAGLAVIDDKIDVPIIETDVSKGAYPTQTLAAWRHAGGGFAGGGGGVLIPLGAGQGVLAELKLSTLFPDFGLALSPSIGYAFGF